MGLTTPTIHCDDSRWPLVSVRFIGELNEADFCEYLKFLDANVARTAAARTKTALLFDAREVGRVPAAIRRMQADWMRDNDDLCRMNAVGFAFVFESSLVRGLLTAILWLAPMPAPHEIVGSVSEAEKFLEHQLALHGVTRLAPRFSLPPRVAQK